ncbi:hypothetical protein SELSPUOL_02643 [Selenomonas sputigena ATCC 35185]|uniref:Uncharacterized protein n=1 Tax=Selenomonas sputigena (strain ATCC 35185 / DSM 20758 / CCUG 44933 / VPI D19B-28) TaxID=546271 RepID=C9LYT2_SELS3|nr:hypothetical protein SELSPUOL_02643 [Selenomonas sputigena ATCC 35185]
MLRVDQNIMMEHIIICAGSGFVRYKGFVEKKTSDCMKRGDVSYSRSFFFRKEAMA